MQNSIVLVFDRLGSGFLGPYGNTWLETPAWNRLAARSILMENVLTDSPDLNVVYHSFWQGQHALGHGNLGTSPALAKHLGSQSVETWLVTDDPVVAIHPLSSDFAERIILPASTTEQATSRSEETQLAQVLATTLDVLERARPPFLIWVHAQAMQGPWDAPYELRCQFADEEDPAPPPFVLPPQQRLQQHYDPDELLGVVHGYAGQVALLDFCLGFLLDAFWSSELASSTALFATSPRGYPLGEHLRIGPCDEALFTELIGVPWLVHMPTRDDWARRDHCITQPADLFATLVDVMGVAPPPSTVWGRSVLGADRGEIAAGFDRAVSCHGNQLAIRAPAWFLRQGGSEEAKLFVKPDDRWEVNEVSGRCRDVVDQLTEVLEQFQAVIPSGARDQLSELSPILRSGLD